MANDFHSNTIAMDKPNNAAVESNKKIGGVGLAEYIAAVVDMGATAVPGVNSTYWVTSERYALEREPTLCLDVPSRDEVYDALRRTRSAVATYNRLADASHPQNAWLYLCQDQSYNLNKLESSVRRNIKRALHEFRFEFIDASTLLQAGAASFCETRSRAGLSDGTPDNFRNCCQSLLKNPAYRILGAWRESENGRRALAAYMTFCIVDDWVTLKPYATTEYLGLRPNNGLFHFGMDYFLAQHRMKTICYGLSSIQEIGKGDTLHRFKLKIGFEAIPIHRTFIFHPFLRPLANRATLFGLRLLVRVRPTNRKLRKAAGLLATYLDKHAATAESQQQSPEQKEEI